MRRFSWEILFLSLLGCHSSPTGYLVPKPDPAAHIQDKLVNNDDISLVFQPQVDILFVIDNSGSMDNYQKTLATNSDLFIQEIKKINIVDYHIGITTTDFNTQTDGKLVGTPSFVERSTPDGFDLLRKRFLVGTAGSSNESVFVPTQKALSEPNISTFNKGFYRPKGYLAIIFVTDAADQSDTTALELYEFLLKLKDWDRNKIITYGVIIPSSEHNCNRDEPGDNSLPRSIEEFLDLSSGQELNLCDSSFGKKLGEIGQDLVKRIGMFIALKQIPVLSSLKVHYGNQIIPEDVHKGWSYDPSRVGINLGSDLKFEEQPGENDLVVDYIPAILDGP